MLSSEDRQEIKKIIADELSWFIKLDRLVLDRNFQILDYKNIQLGRGNGTQIGTDTDQKLGFFGKTPVDRPATVTDPSGGLTVDAEARVAISALIDRLQEIGLIA